MGILGTPATVAQAQSVDVWMEVATANPAWGCYVDTSVEVHVSAGLPGFTVVGLPDEQLVRKLAPGEATKSFADLARLCDWLLATGIEREPFVR